jgi:hypothetical protein
VVASSLKKMNDELAGINSRRVIFFFNLDGRLLIKDRPVIHFLIRNGHILPGQLQELHNRLHQRKRKDSCGGC